MSTTDVETQVETFDRALQNADGAQPIMAAVCQQLSLVAPADIVSISLYSEDEHHLRTLFRHDPEALIKSDQRWYPISPLNAAWVRNPEIEAYTLEDLLNGEFRSFRDDQSVKRIVAQGYKRILRYPIVRGGRVIASVTSMSKDPSAFDSCQVEIARRLPIAKAVMMALHYLETDELRFRFRLVKELFGYTSPKQLADLLGHRLAHHYGWKSVDIYFVDTSAQKFKLLAHDGTSEGFNPQAFEQDLDAGILGYVYRTGEDLNIADVSSDQGFKGADTKMRPYTLSVLCMPVRVDGQIRALLNIEDNLRSAFSRDEQVLLRNLLDELGSLLAAAETQSLIVQTFRATPSAVFVTDSNGKIMRTNPAASALLGHEPAELVNRSISHYFVDCEDPRKLLKSGSPEIETGLKTNTGRIVPVLAGVHELQGFDAWVISAKDISYRKRLEQLEMLGQMYRELAAQMKTPLTLISGWLRRLRKEKETSDPATADVITRTLAQVKKLDITFDRLAFYDQNSGFAPYNEILLDIPKLLDRIVAELPQSEFASVVRNGGRNTGAYVRGDAYRITFIIETILSYLFRFLPQDDQIKVDVASGVEAVEITISGWFPAPNHSGDEPDVTPEGIREALNDMALGEQVITRFMAELHGRYSKTQSEDGELRFILNFPKARVEV